MHETPTRPTFDDVLAAAARIAPHAHVTPVLHSRALDASTGASLAFKGEHLQRVGAFKFRGACNAVWSLDDATTARGVVTHSSGNHGAALALAARLRGIPCHVVVPAGAVRAKLAAIEHYGAILHHCAPTIAARESMCAQVQAETGAASVHPYTDPRVIAGQGTAALELLTAHPDLDALVVPLGGGGLAAGTALAMHALAPACKLYLAEPVGAADAQVLTIDDAQVVTAMRLLWTRTKQLVEPSSATALAAMLANRALFEGRRVGIILSGGNIDLDALPALFAKEAQP